MNYTIKDNNHILRLSLDTDELHPPLLEVYINDESTRHLLCPPVGYSPPYTYDILFSRFEIGDVITKLKLIQGESVKPWDTHEGIRILLDGEEVIDPSYTVTNNVYYFNIDDGFRDAGQHDIQAVYVGNNEYNPSWTDKYHFVVEQPPVQEQGTPSVDGEYRLIFTKETPNATYYNESITFGLKLLKGGVPVGAGKTIERATATGIGSAETNSKGIVYFTSENWDVGKYKIGGYYTADSKRICSVYKDFEVKKAPSRIEIDGGSYVKGDKIIFRFYYNESDRLNKEKVQLYVNGKLIDKQTSEHGVVSYRFGSKGTFKFKAVWKGNDNIDKAEMTTTITISE